MYNVGRLFLEYFSFVEIDSCLQEDFSDLCGDWNNVANSELSNAVISHLSSYEC